MKDILPSHEVIPIVSQAVVLSAYCMLDIMLDSGDSVVNEAENNPCLLEFPF